ncbi:MAG: hypothetical protein QN137_07685, partial [Armatimonadota bacterium]|nr:hypothetical protein [Armatimonadota bacterium]
SASPIVHVPYEEAYGPGFEDILYRVPELTKLRAFVGFTPRLCLDEIIDRVVTYTRERLAVGAGSAAASIRDPRRT